MPLKPNEIIAKLGKHFLNDTNEIYSIDSLVEDIVINSEWNPNTKNYNAVIILSEEVEFNSFIRPVCLPQFSYAELSGFGRFIGWGASKHGQKNENFPSILKVRIVNSSYCLTKASEIAETFSVDSFCGGFENEGKALCHGDNGGGIYSRSQETTLWEITGIASVTNLDKSGQCNANTFQTFTNVARFVQWIEKVMRRNK
jgi:secreted trypsin-like serine protease